MNPIDRARAYKEMLELRNKNRSQEPTGTDFMIPQLSQEIDVSETTIRKLLKLLDESKEVQERIIQAYENAQQSGIEEGERMNIVDEGNAYLKLLKHEGYRFVTSDDKSRVHDMGIRKLAAKIGVGRNRIRTAIKAALQAPKYRKDIKKNPEHARYHEAANRAKNHKIKEVLKEKIADDEFTSGEEVQERIIKAYEPHRGLMVIRRCWKQDVSSSHLLTNHSIQLI